MATIYNSELQKQIIVGAKIQTAVDKTPNKLGDVVIPVMEVNPLLLKTAQIVRRVEVTNNTSGTIYTTPTNQDFYITSVSVSVIKDVTSTSTYTRIAATVEGSTVYLASIAELTLTAQSNNITIPFPRPIKIDRGTNVLLQNSANTANITTNATITGFIDEASLA